MPNLHIAYNLPILPIIVLFQQYLLLDMPPGLLFISLKYNSTQYNRQVMHKMFIPMRELSIQYIMHEL